MMLRYQCFCGLYFTTRTRLDLHRDCAGHWVCIFPRCHKLFRSRKELALHDLYAHG